MTSGERILFVIDHLKVSKNKFSTKMLGLSASTKLDHIIKGRNDITKELAKEICSVVPEINYEWLYKGEGEIFVENHGATKIYNSPIDVDFNYLANALIEHEDELMKIPKVHKMIERHALIMLNDKMPDLVERIYSSVLARKS